MTNMMQLCVGGYITHTSGAGVFHNMHSFQNGTFTIESDMQEHLHEGIILLPRLTETCKSTFDVLLKQFFPS